MRNTFKNMWHLTFVIPTIGYLGFWLAFPKLFGFFNNRRHFNRSFRMAATIANTSVFWVLFNSYPFRDKQFHEVLTQPEPNGKYVRTVLRVRILINEY